MVRAIKVNQWLLIVIGALCILSPAHIARILPYLLGGVMALIGIADISLWNRDPQKEAVTADLSHGLVLLIVGVSFALQGENALFPMGITWAIFGIRKASQTLAHLIQAIERQEASCFLALEFCVRILLALLLLFNPLGKFTPHLRILGAELIISNVQPAIKQQRKADSHSNSEPQPQRTADRKDE